MPGAIIGANQNWMTAQKPGRKRMMVGFKLASYPAPSCTAADN